jgi:hypothetical protein
MGWVLRSQKGAGRCDSERAQENISERNNLSDYARLKATWGVSIQALIQRGYALDLVGETRRRSLFVQLSSKGWRKQEPVHVGREALLLLLWTLMSRRYGPKPYRAAAEEVAVPPTMLRLIAPTPDTTPRHGGHNNRKAIVAPIRRVGR